MKNILTLSENKSTPIVIGALIALMMILLGAMNAIVLLLGIFTLIIMLKKPIFALFIYILGLPFLQDAQMMYIGALVIVVYCIHFLKNGYFKYNYTKANLYILLYGIIIVINTFLSISPRGSFRDFAIHFIAFGILFVFLHSDKTKRDLNNISILLVLVGTAVAIYGIYQFFNGVPMESGWLDVSQNPNIKTRVYATFENPNLLAEYLIMILPISIALFLCNKGFVGKVLYTFTSAIILITILLTYSRGSWIGLAFGIVLFLMIVNWKTLLVFLPLGIAGIFVLPSSIFQRILTIGSLQDSSNLYRFNLWIKSINIVKDFWVSGIGIGYIPFREIIPLYITNIAPYHTHNTYLQIAIEMGIPGLLLFVSLIFITFKMALGNAINSKDKDYKIILSAYIAGLSGILIHGIAEHIFFNPKIILIFWLIFGILINYCQIHNGESNRIIDKG